ncbi:MAG: hypothetical protein QOK38_2063 [Acidobacteriaceae bacterium]|jgi:hypothetical protein|nr:hypothetical protein [Acidobacteriaceae bacterium]
MWSEDAEQIAHAVTTSQFCCLTESMISNLSRRTTLLMLGSVAASAAIVHAQWNPALRYGPPRASHRLQIGGATLQLDFATGALDLADDIVTKRIEMAAHAVATYYGIFPVPRVRILIVPVADRSGVVQGTTWGDVGGWPGFTRIRLGQHTTQQELAADWTITHELVHMAFPTLPDDQHWMEEGLATYIEPIARVQAGELSAKQIWRDMLDGMPKGEPQPGDEGLDRTHTWGRTYWGGALFCLVADVQIRVATTNRKGLQDALRAVVAAGGTIDHDWPLTRALQIGDTATGTRVLMEQYRSWSTSPTPVDLEKLWQQLGIQRTGEQVEFSAAAQYAKIREAITQARPLSV